jgi:phage recombination protein Bet
MSSLQPPAPSIFTPDQIQLIKNTLLKGGTDDQLALFLHHCTKTGLDPLSRQIYAMLREDRKTGQMLMTIQVSIDGFRLVAERTGKYRGQVGPEWCGPDGVWQTVWTKTNQPPHAARVGVIKSGFDQPLYAVCHWAEYVQTHFDRQQNRQVPSATWAKMPTLMLAKVAEALAMRRAFPQELSGLYTPDEMARVEKEAQLADEKEQEQQKIKFLMSELKQLVSKYGWTMQKIADITGVEALARPGEKLPVAQWEKVLAGLKNYAQAVETYVKPKQETTQEETSPINSEPKEDPIKAECKAMMVQIGQWVVDGTFTWEDITRITGVESLSDEMKKGNLDVMRVAVDRLQEALKLGI